MEKNPRSIQILLISGWYFFPCDLLQTKLCYFYHQEKKLAGDQETDRGNNSL